MSKHDVFLRISINACLLRIYDVSSHLNGIRICESLLWVKHRLLSPPRLEFILARVNYSCIASYGANIRTSRMILLLGNITDNLFVQ